MVAAILIAAVLVFAASRPSTFRVERSISVSAPAERIFQLISDFHNWKDWAPQDREDPTMSRTFRGPTNGAGALSEWDSRGSAGKGRMSIVESQPPTKISIQVDFVKPFEAHNLNEFTLEPDGGSTKVTWTMQGTNLYVMKVMSIFVNMDKMAGKHFEDGLANLKAVAEK